MARLRPLASVTEEKKGSTQAAPRLYDLTTLQREANNRYGLPARRTLQIAFRYYDELAGTTLAVATLHLAHPWLRWRLER